MINKLLKSVIDTDEAPVVICDVNSTVVYMNPSAILRYGKDLTGACLKSCHSPQANKKIDMVIEWFEASQQNNKVYTYRNEKENKDVYMIALRDEMGKLIGYYEKHEYRTRESSSLYQMG